MGNCLPTCVTPKDPKDVFEDKFTRARASSQSRATQMLPIGNEKSEEFSVYSLQSSQRNGSVATLVNCETNSNSDGDGAEDFCATVKFNENAGKGGTTLAQALFVKQKSTQRIEIKEVPVFESNTDLRSDYSLQSSRCSVKF